jgi:hypothetical protein
MINGIHTPREQPGICRLAVRTESAAPRALPPVGRWPTRIRHAGCRDRRGSERTAASFLTRWLLWNFTRWGAVAHSSSVRSSPSREPIFLRSIIDIMSTSAREGLRPALPQPKLGTSASTGEAGRLPAVSDGPRAPRAIGRRSPREKQADYLAERRLAVWTFAVRRLVRVGWRPVEASPVGWRASPAPGAAVWPGGPGLVCA